MIECRRSGVLINKFAPFCSIRKLSLLCGLHIVAEGDRSNKLGFGATSSWHNTQAGGAENNNEHIFHISLTTIY